MSYRINSLFIGIIVTTVFLFYSYFTVLNKFQKINDINTQITHDITKLKTLFSTQIPTIIPTTPTIIPTIPIIIPSIQPTVSNINEFPSKLKPFLQSQSGQDKYVYDNFFLNKKTPGIYVEFGARDGKEHSNTYFYEFGLGWTGLLVEFEDSEFNKLVKNRPGSLVIQGAVCKEHKIKEFALSKNIGWHGDPDHYTSHRKPLLGKKVKVKCYTLNELLTESGIRYIDYMTVDTEGSELSLLEVFDFNLFVVDIIQIEVLMGEKEIKQKIHQLLISKGYDHIIDYIVTPNDTWDLIYKRNVRVDMTKINDIKKNGWSKNLTENFVK